MTTIVITGMARDTAAGVANASAGGRIHVITSSDYDGVVALKSGRADYFLGICQSGAGGALALATAMLGTSRVATVSTAGTPPVPEAIDDAIRDGKIAFGFAVDHIEQVVPRLVEAILHGRA